MVITFNVVDWLRLEQAPTGILALLARAKLTRESRFCVFLLDHGLRLAQVWREGLPLSVSSFSSKPRTRRLPVLLCSIQVHSLLAILFLSL